MPAQVVPRHRRSFAAVLATVGAVVALLVPAASVNAAQQSSSTSKLIAFELSFPCGLNNYATQLCAGVKAAAKKLPPGFRVEIKTGINYSDTVAYNNLIQTTTELHPAGLIMFPNGPAAQVPVLNQACAKGIKIIVVDSPTSGFKCQTALIGANHYQLGVEIGKWLIAHPPTSKQIGIVSLAPGEYASNDARVKGFTTTVTAAGYSVVATAITDLTLDTTRTEVTNMLTAHPNIGTILSANDAMGDGTAQAVTNSKIVQLSIDGATTSVQRIQTGSLSADAAQDPYRMGILAVQSMVKAIQGKHVPTSVYTPSEVVDSPNVAAYLKAGGLH